MKNIQEINWNSIEDKIQKASFDLFRFWTNASGIDETVVIKTEKI